MTSIEELLQYLPKTVEHEQRLVQEDASPSFGLGNCDGFDDTMFNPDFDIFENRLMLDDDLFQMKHLNQLTTLDSSSNALNAQHITAASSSSPTSAPSTFSLLLANGNGGSHDKNRERKKTSLRQRKSRSFGYEGTDKDLLKLKQNTKSKPILRRMASETGPEGKSKTPRSIHPQIGRPRFILGLTDDTERQKRHVRRMERRIVQCKWEEGVTSYPVANFRTNEIFPFPYAYIDEAGLFRRYHAIVDHFDFVQNFVATEIQSNHCSLSRIITGEYPYQTKSKYVRRFRTWLLRVDQSISKDLAVYAAWKGDTSHQSIATQLKVDVSEVQQYFDCTLDLDRRSSLESRLLVQYRDFAYEQKTMNLPLVNPISLPNKDIHEIRRDEEDEAILQIYIVESEKLRKARNNETPVQIAN